MIEQLTADNVPVSVDPFLPGIQRFAVARSAAYPNDIWGFPDPSLYGELAAASCRLVVMHSVQRDRPAAKVATDPAAVRAGIDSFFADRLAVLQAAGIGPERLIIDPGSATNPEPSLPALAGIRHLKTRFGLPVLVSPSCKSFLRTLTIRTHDVPALNDAFAVLARCRVGVS